MFLIHSLISMHLIGPRDISNGKIETFKGETFNVSHFHRHSEKTFWLEMLAIVLIIQSTAKFLQLIRYNESFCLLVQMLTQVTVDIYPFLIVFFTFQLIFVLITIVLEYGYTEDGYDTMESFSLIITIL